MKRPVWIAILIIVIAAAAVFYVARHRHQERVVTDLVDAFPSATKRPSSDTFSVIDATIGGQQKRSIFTKDSSRLVYNVAVPDNAELKLSLGLLENAWTVKGDGVLFRVLVTPENGAQDELLNIDINPYANPSDRSWHDIALDLSEYAGEAVQIVLDTNSSPPSRPPRDDRAGDLAVWGDPRVVTH